MDALITVDDFKGLYNISPDSNNDADIDLFISNYQDKYLRYFMGEKMFSEFDVDLDINKKLINGTEVFLFDSKWMKFDGFKKMLVPFVYFHYMRENTSKSTPLGLIEPEISNSKLVKPIDECIQAWNNAVDIYQIGINYCNLKSNIYSFFQYEELGHINFLGI